VIKISVLTDEVYQPIGRALDFIETYMAPVRHVELRGVSVDEGEKKGISDLDRPDLAKVKEILEERGFGVSSVSSGFGKYKRTSWEDGEEWKLQQALLERALEASTLLGAPYTRCFGFRRVEGVPLENCLETIAERLGWAADLAQEHDVVLALETEGGLYADTAENTRRILDAVNSRYLRVNYDVGNSFAVGDSVWPDGFHLLKDYMVFMHVKSMRTPLGKKIDYLNIFRELKRMEFDGFLSNEHHTRGGAPAALELHQDILRLFDRIY